MKNKVLVNGVLATLAAMALTACGGGSSLTDEPPTEEKPYVLSATELAYGASSRQKLDFYPAKEGVPLKGLFVWVHGGGWYFGEKAGGQVEVFKSFPLQGIAVVSMTYRVGTEGVYPRSVDDVDSALSAIAQGGCAACDKPDVWKKIAQAANTRLMVSGESAGGYLAVMGAANHLIKEPTPSLQCIHNHVGPVDFRGFDSFGQFSKELVVNYAGGDSSMTKLSEMSPTYHLEKGAWQSLPRTLKWYLDYSQQDKLVLFSETRKFTEQLKAQNHLVHENILNYPEDGSHAMPVQGTRDLVTAAVTNCFND